MQAASCFTCKKILPNNCIKDNSEFFCDNDCLRNAMNQYGYCDRCKCVNPWNDRGENNLCGNCINLMDYCLWCDKKMNISEMYLWGSYHWFCNKICADNLRGVKNDD